MSLRYFHIVFIAASVGLSIFVAIWGIREFRATDSMGALVLAIAFMLCGVALVAYADRAFRKLRDL